MIYAIYSKAFGDLIEATTMKASADFWREANYRIDELQAPSDEECNAIEAIQKWLIENYKRGGHWIFETTNEATHIVRLREFGGNVEAYKADMARDFEAIEEYAEDIRNA